LTLRIPGCRLQVEEIITERLLLVDEAP